MSSVNLASKLFLLSAAFINSASGTSPPQCDIKFDISVCYDKPSAQRRGLGPKCRDDVTACRKGFTITHIDVEPYTTDIVRDLVKRCCGGCTNISQPAILKDVSQIPNPVDNPTDLLFPILARSSARKVYGYHFVPLIEPPSLYYFTLKDKEVLKRLIVHCLNTWPLLLTCFFLTGVSGFLAWLMEMRSNSSEFSPSFFSGWMSGCWWSFVSMTTVGYGDKVPKSQLTRLFAVFWILIGITTFSIITAMLTSELTVANSAGQPEMAGQRIGALKHRTYDTIMIASHGGIAINSSDTWTQGIKLLVQMLKEKKIDGFVLDRFTLITYFNHLKENSDQDHREDVRFFQTECVRSEMPFKGDKLSYGILMKSREDYEYFVDFVMDNQQVINACNGLMLNSNSEDIRVKATENEALFSSQGELFWPSIIIGSIAMSAIVCFGLVYQWKMQKDKMSDGVTKKLMSKITLNRQKSKQESSMV